MPGILDQKIAETPIAVIDFETTGLTPGYDRVVEVSVVRIEPGQEPTLVFDTLVNPLRPMSGTEIHGIADQHVELAPRFSQIAGELVEATKGCVIAAYNIYFDVKFLQFELSNSGLRHAPPYLCLMYLRPLLGLGKRCKLDEACQLYGIEFGSSHVAAHDALAAGRLYQHYRTEIENRGIHTFADLANAKTYKFAESFANSPFPDPVSVGLRRSNSALSRAKDLLRPDPMRLATAGYWDLLREVLSDLEITDDELAEVMNFQAESGLPPERIRVLHARAFASVMAQFAADQMLDDREARKLKRLHQCLAKLGWAPGG